MSKRRKVGQIERKPGFFYFIDGKGAIYEIPRPTRKRKR